MRRLLLMLMVAAMLLTGCNAKKEAVKENGECLRSFVLTNGYKSNGTLNGFELNDEVKAYLLNMEKGDFEESKLSDELITGNFVAVYDTDTDEKINYIEVVKYDDADKYWDCNLSWTAGAGEADPGISDELGETVFSEEYVIPYGERLLNGIGIGAWSATVDFQNQDDITYYADLDYYNLKSNGNLTMLTGYKTRLQPTGWTCGLSSLLTVLEWYGLRGTLNDYDLANLRHTDKWASGTNIEEMLNVITELKNLDIIGDYSIKSWLDDPEGLFDPEFVKSELLAGHPIMVLWNAYGWHWQVIIGYDDMGTIDRTEDDVIILADAYDTTDHNQDGYVIDGFERLVYGWYSSFEDEIKHNDFIAVFPASQYEEVVQALTGNN